MIESRAREPIKMKTIVFHSYKGGVGRSLALANLAFALSEANKNVVVLDLDVDAPGLHSKLALASSRMENWEQRVQGGYIDYLAHFFGSEGSPQRARKGTVRHKPEHADLKSRKEYLLRSCVIELNDYLKFIPAGKADQKYWWNLASPWFNELFAISRNEYSSTGTVRLHQKREFLRAEKEVIQALFPSGTDYFLVDCKSAREYSSVPLYYWANVIVSMFPANVEGICGAARIHQFVASVRNDDSSTVKIIPVACRVPGDFVYSTLGEDYHEVLKEYFNQYMGVNEGTKDAVIENRGVVRLREYRELETRERILTSERVPAKEKEWYHELKMDYVKLFASIFDDADEARMETAPEPRSIKLNNVNHWMQLLGMAELKSFDDGSYQIKPNHGIVENKDDQRNVLLRASSLRILINNVAKAIANQRTRRNTLIDVGRTIGMNFGAEFSGSDRFFKRDSLLEKKIKIWCDYDSQNAGFGILTPSFNDDGREITIRWNDSFLDETELSDRKMQPRFGFWLAQGYLEGVIKELAEYNTYPPEVPDKKKSSIRVQFIRRETDPAAFVFKLA